MEIVQVDEKSKIRSTDRVIVIKRKEGEHTLNSKGIVDNRLFTGQNKLHAVFDPDCSMWYLKFDAGLLPPAFKQHFTSFSKLLKFVTEYYDKRNIEIKEVLD